MDIWSHYEQLKQENQLLQAQNAKLKREMREMNSSFDLELLRFNNKKNFFKSCNSSKKKIEAQVKNVLLELNKSFCYLGLHLSNANFTESIYGKEEDVTMRIVKDVADIFPREDKKMDVFQVLNFKDSCNISDRTYHQLIQQLKLKKMLPNLNEIKIQRKSLDQKLKIYSNKFGVYVKASEKIENILNKHFKNHKEKFLSMNGIIKIKISGDGTLIGRTLKLFNFTFSLLDFDNAQAASGTYTLGIFEIESESHEFLKDCLSEIVNDLRKLTSIKLGDQEFKIVIYLGGDMKFLAIVRGINAAGAIFPCVWCKCPRTAFSKYRTEEWSLICAQKGARHVEEGSTKISGKTVEARKGYIREAIIDFIPTENVVVDLLHLFVRIADLLTELLFSALENLDGGFNVNHIERNVNFCNFIKFLEKTCKIRASHVINEKKIKLRGFTGGEYLTIFAKIDIVKLFPQLENNSEIDLIWADFYNVYILIRDDMLNANEIKKHTHNFVDLFLTIYPKTKITPYMHCFASHLHEFKQLHGDINLFNQQGVEKLNDVTTQQYFRSSNKNRSDNTTNNYLFQLLKKRNRLEWFI